MPIMYPAFRRTDHRPWSLPPGPWTWRQQWKDLLFAHWPMPAAALRPFVPEALAIQEFDGTSWVGLVPFRMTGVMHRPLPDLPWISAFPEMNLRLYVEHGGRAGVWFISLDAANALAVWAARRFFHLPYFHARMGLRQEGERVRYVSERLSGGRGGARVVFRGSYGPVSAPYEAKPGSLEHFLTERYCLYSQAPDGSILRGEVHHVPWPLQRAEAEIETNEVAGPQGMGISSPPALLHFSRSLDVAIWPLRRA
jgi:uncharacterized protein YqjF (DUF2071 family)